MDIRRLEEALLAADAAGDTEAAQALADAIRQYRSAPAPAPAPAPKPAPVEPPKPRGIMDGLREAVLPFTSAGRMVAASKPPAEKPAEPKRAEPAPYKDKTEALDDAVNFVEEGQPIDEVAKVFSGIGIDKAAILAHGKGRGSEAFLPAKDRAGLSGRFAPTTKQAEMREVQPTAVEGLVINPLKRGKENIGSTFDVLAHRGGLLDDETFSRVMARRQDALGAARPSHSTELEMAAIQEAGKEGWGELFTALRKNPTGLITMLADSVIQSTPSMAMAVVGTGLAGPAGGGAAAGAASAAAEYSSALTSAMTEAGYDPSNAADVLRFVRNPELLDAARTSGLKRGLTIGVFDGLSAGLAGRFMTPVVEAAQRGSVAGRKLAMATGIAAGKEAGAQAGFGAGGEALAQILDKGKIDDRASVALEAFAEVAGAPVEVASNVSSNLANTPGAILAAEIRDAARDGAWTADGDQVARGLLSPNPDAISPELTTRPAQPARPSISQKAGITPVEGGTAEPTVDGITPIQTENPDEDFGALTRDILERERSAAQGATEALRPGGAALADGGGLLGQAIGQPEGARPDGPGDAVRVADPAAAQGLTQAAPVPYTGKRADGYATKEAAQQALDSGRPQARHPGLIWSIELTPGGTYVPMGRAVPSTDGQELATGRPGGDARGLGGVDGQGGLRDLEAGPAGRRVGAEPNGLDPVAANAERVADANAGFAETRARLANDGGLKPDTPLADLQPADEAEVRSIAPVLEAVSEALGTPPVAVAKSSSKYDGVNWVGRNIVNVQGLEKPAVFVAAHESVHSLQNLARDARRARQSGLAPTAEQADAQRIWEPMEQAIWDMVPEDERAIYAASALEVKPREMAAWLAEPKNQEVLRREFMADFGAKRLTNPDDVRALAQREPKLFGDFARKMIDGLGKVIDTLRGKYKGLGKRNANDADRYIKDIKDLQRAKLMWQDALVAWKKRGGASAAPVKMEAQTQAQVGTTAAGPGGSQALPESDPSFDERGVADGPAPEVAADAAMSARAQPDADTQFELRPMREGSLRVLGDQEAIRALLPADVKGRKVPGGMLFTPSDAPRARAAIEGRRLAYSRAGQVVDKLPMKDGKYVGAPEKFNTPQKIPQLRKILRQLAEEGAPGRFWYENSSKEVLQMVGGDVNEARKFVALLAIYSPQAKVDTNSTFALRAWSQYKAGQPISVKTKVMDDKATAALNDIDAFWSGEKTGNFFNNLLREIDPSVADKQGATIDMWMMRAAQYVSDAPTATQYAFMENENNRIARELGWEPQQVQAAIWVAMKARTENKGVKQRTEAVSEKKGWIRFDEANGKKVRVILDAQKHRDNWLKHAMEHDVTKGDTQAAKFDFSDGLRRHIGQISWEARPGRSTGVLPGVNDAPYEQQVEFQQAVQKALYSEEGADLLAQQLGLLVDGPDVLAPGVWQSEVAAGMQKQVAMAPGKGEDGKTIDPSQKRALDLYAATLGLLLRQEGVGWHRPFYKGKRSDENGVELRIGRPLTPDEAKVLWAAVDDRMRAAGVADWEQGAGMISSPVGMRLVNFGAVDNNAKFRDLIQDAASALAVDEVDPVFFSSDGNLVTNDWKEAPNGQGFARSIREAGRPDLLGWAASVLAPRVQAVFNEFSAKYGWGNPGQVSDLFDEPSYSGRPGGPDAAGSGRGGEVPGGQSGALEGQAYGVATPGAAAPLEAYHFSQGRRSSLNSGFYGAGLRGAEAERLGKATDQRIKRRVYFYFDQGTGIKPESGVGGHAHRVTLNNLYDISEGRIRGADANAFESAVLDAGYDGYIVRLPGSQSGQAVLLGAHSVPVEYLGQGVPGKTQPATTSRAADTSSRMEGGLLASVKPIDIAAIKGLEQIRAVAPSFKFEYGKAKVDPAEAELASAMLKELGSDVSFSRRTDPYAEFDGRTATIQVKVLETGEVATMTFDAGKRLRDLDERGQTFEKLLECLAR